MTHVYPMKFLETEWRQRKYDGKWEMLAKIMDYDNMYSYKSDETGARVSLIPEKWIAVKVCDYLVEIE